MDTEAAVSTAEVSPSADNDRFDKGACVSGVIPGCENRCIGISNVVNESAVAFEAALHRDVSRSVNVSEFRDTVDQVPRLRATWGQLRPKSYLLAGNRQSKSDSKQARRKNKKCSIHFSFHRGFKTFPGL